MMEALRRWLFPEQTRHLQGARALSITFRTFHMIGFGVLLGGHVFAVEAEKLLPSLWLTIMSGLGLIALEMSAAGLYWLFLGKGIMILAKLALLLMVPFFWESRLILLLLIVVIASVGSHMPARYRHYSLLHQRVIGPGKVPLHPSPALWPRAAVVASLDDRDLKRR